jgi:hypothetical protein
MNTPVEDALASITPAEMRAQFDELERLKREIM